MFKRFIIIAISILLPLFVFGQSAEECLKKGNNYYYGRDGVTQDYAKAIKWYLKAAKQGNVDAQYSLGTCYKEGCGVIQDYIESVKWYGIAAKQGHVAAQYNLGVCYNFGLGVTKDYAEAVKWYYKAAERGNDFAQYNLGLCYEKGNGVTQDYKLAKEWYQIALSRNPNFNDPKEGLARVEKLLSEQSGGNSYAQNTTPQTQPVTITQPQTTPQQKIGNSPIDTDIPTTDYVNKNTFAIIIANEDYQGESKVEYAKNDGEVFKNYCHKTLGLPEKNVHYVANATLNNLIGELDWLQQVCKAFKGDASVIFYYAGHGLPNETTHSAYLLPSDGNSRLIRTCFSLNELYETLGKLPAKKVTVLMDACFSGAKRDGEMLASTRGVAIKPKASVPMGNMIVLSAAQGDETAYKYEETKHGLFTYFLLKKLKDTKGNVTMGELSSYLQDQVGRYSIVENGKSQTPSVQISAALISKWQSMKFE